ncbi:MAG TPA: hypothetical protein ENF41_04415 [Candidatus Bathyarchaeota archaeon]|nr:hypothetical protein [Candidatus Bathyarchaeota archaeon]
MPSKKKEFERIFNQLLGTNIKWSKLSLEELYQLAALFNNPEILLQRLGVKTDITRVVIKDKIFQGLSELLKNYDGPVIRMLKALLQEEEK